MEIHQDLYLMKSTSYPSIISIPAEILSQEL